MSALRDFRTQLIDLMADPYARPFVCTDSPLACRAFIVGFNAATRLPNPFIDYWSDETGFLKSKFDLDYAVTRKKRGNRPVMEAIASSLQPCLETNLYAAPTAKARQLPKALKSTRVLEFLFDAIRPEVVFAHSKPAVAFFETVTGAGESTSGIKEACWMGHRFQLYGRTGPLYTLGPRRGLELGMTLAGFGLLA